MRASCTFLRCALHLITRSGDVSISVSIVLNSSFGPLLLHYVDRSELTQLLPHRWKRGSFQGFWYMMCHLSQFGEMDSDLEYVHFLSPQNSIESPPRRTHLLSPQDRAGENPCILSPHPPPPFVSGGDHMETHYQPWSPKVTNPS